MINLVGLVRTVTWEKLEGEKKIKRRGERTNPARTTTTKDRGNGREGGEQ
jgi:hypothetical protein